MVRRSNAILSINPSYATNEERFFWTEVARHIKDSGYRLIQIATRAIPEIDNAITVCLPARLGDINRELFSLPLNKDLPWVSDEFLHCLEDWEHIRWMVDWRTPGITMGLLRLAAFVDAVMNLVEPSFVLTTNKIDHPQALFRLAAAHAGCGTAVVERSPLDSIWLEPNGLFAESRIWREYPPDGRSLAQNPSDIEKLELAKILANPYGFRNDAKSSNLAAKQITAEGKPIFFLPMDNVLWTGWQQYDHPMRIVDSPLYESPKAAIDDLARSVDSLGGQLIVKAHPACVCMTESLMPANCRLVDLELASIIEAADVVIAFNTKVAFPAVAMGKPVVTLAPNPIARSGSTFHCLDKTAVDRTLRDALNREGLDAKLDRFPPFIGWLSTEYFYSCEDTPPPYAKSACDFAKDIIESLDEKEIKPLGSAELDEIKRQLCDPAPYKPKKIVPLATPAGKYVTPSAARRAVRLLTEEGTAAFARKLKQKLGKTSRPKAVNYDARWGPAVETLDADSLVRFSGLWGAHPLHYQLYEQANCPIADGSRVESLRGRFTGKAVILADIENLPADALESGDYLLIADEDVFSLKKSPAQRTLLVLSSPDFLVKHIGHLRYQSSMRLVPTRLTIFSPLKFRGLVPGAENVYWYKDRPSTSGQRETARKAAIDIARALGFSPIRDLMGSESSIRHCETNEGVLRE